jgi:valyl-tRNA synthetase
MNECRRVEAFDPGAARLTVNRWVRGETVKAAQQVSQALEVCAFDDVAGGLYRFIWNGVCDWYLELAKPILMGSDEAAKAETRAMAAWTLDQALVMLHPVAPFLTEALWEQTAEFGPPRSSMLIEASWPNLPDTWVDADAASEIDWVIDLVNEVRSIRAEMNVPPSARAPLVLVGADSRTQGRAARQRDRLCTLARLDSIRFADQAPAGAVQFVIGAATGCLSIAEFIDLDAERARLAKAISGLDSDIVRVRKKLDNAEFMAKAPEAVVAENREKLADAETAKAKMAAALDRLAAVG